MQLYKTFAVAVVLVAALLAAGSRATPQEDQAKANRNSLLLRRGNVGRPLGRTTPTTTTTTSTPSPADYAEDEYADSYDEGKGEEGGDEGGEEGGKQPTTTTTTTEAPKKIRPSIRPFRSNDDLLTALKKRRQESKNSKPAAVAPKEKVYDDEDLPAPAAPAPAKSAKAPAIASNKRRFGAARKDDHAAESSNDGHDGQGSDGGSSGSSSNGAKSLIGRLGRSRFALKQ
uniref:Uncharacterized protein n=1 Tax=Anopheles dirus TaxID=7168 RepID=A0A182N022_9DIPT